MASRSRSHDSPDSRRAGRDALANSQFFAPKGNQLGLRHISDLRVQGLGLQHRTQPFRNFSVNIIEATGLSLGTDTENGEITAGDESAGYYCICEIANRQNTSIRTPTSVSANWNFSGDFTRAADDETLSFSLWNSTRFLGRATMTVKNACQGFVGELAITGGGQTGASVSMRTAVRESLAASGSSPLRRGGNRVRLGRSASTTESSERCSWPRSARSVSEPPASEGRRPKPTNRRSGPERLYYDIPSVQEPSNSQGCENWVCTRQDLSEIVRPGLRAEGGTHLSAKRMRRPKSAAGRLQTTGVPPGRETNAERWPEKLFFDTAGYTGTHKLGGPTTAETGPITQIHVLGTIIFAAAVESSEHRVRRFVKRGHLGSRPYFEQAGGQAYIYCYAQRMWCLSENLGDHPDSAYAVHPSWGQEVPLGPWRTNGQNATGDIEIRAVGLRVGNLSQVTRCNLNYSVGKRAPATREVEKSWPQEAPVLSPVRSGPSQNYEASTFASARQHLLPPTAALQLRPNLRREGGTHVSSSANSRSRREPTRCASPRRMDASVNLGAETDPWSGPETLFYEIGVDRMKEFGIPPELPQRRHPVPVSSPINLDTVGVDWDPDRCSRNPPATHARTFNATLAEPDCRFALRLSEARARILKLM